MPKRLQQSASGDRAQRRTTATRIIMLAKTLEPLKDAAAADIDNQARTISHRRTTVTRISKRNGRSRRPFDDVDLRVEQPQRKDFVSVVLAANAAADRPRRRSARPTTLLAQARTQFKERQRRRGDGHAPPRARQRADERRELSAARQDPSSPRRSSIRRSARLRPRSSGTIA